MLDARKEMVLRAIVREYVRSGQPISSKMLAGRYLPVSSATVRNDMAALEELGYIAQPHTSAGRIPTSRGYRWFVDNWPGPDWPQLPSRERRAIRVAVPRDTGDLEDALDATSQVLSRLTEAVGVVAAPPLRKNLLRRIELLHRDDRRATLLLIADTGVVEQGIVQFPGPRSHEELGRLAAELSVELDGVLFEDLPARIRRRGHADPDREAAAGEIERILERSVAERIFRGGTANILSPDKALDLESAHMIVGILERPVVLGALLGEARRAGQVTVLIGEENPIREMRVCGVVFAPYGPDADRVGTLGVIGPTRMDYPHTISAVAEVARWLSGLLGPAE